MRLLMSWADRQSSGRFGSQELAQSHADRLRKWLRLLALAKQIKRERQDLLELGEHELQDIGVYEADARMEAHRGLWDLPEHRVKQLQ
ncbi:MAG: hypothetical protein KTR35_10530 [Gammaproteobacteria bacterium]|nr:hypothetical protein [Gammaproteobacteria bacterium]